MEEGIIFFDGWQRADKLYKALGEALQPVARVFPGLLRVISWRCPKCEKIELYTEVKK